VPAWLGPTSAIAENLEKRAQAKDKKVTDLSVKLGKSAGELATAEENLSREIRSTAKEEDKKKAEVRNREQADARRRQKEKSHAREIARLASPMVRYVIVEPPKPEVLRVLYMTANPEMDLRTEVEVVMFSRLSSVPCTASLSTSSTGPRLPLKTCSTA